MYVLRKSPTAPGLATPVGQGSAAADSKAPVPSDGHESLPRAVLRWMFGIAYALQPQRILSVPHLLFWTAHDLLRGGTVVPTQNRTRSRPDTFAGVVRDLTPETYLLALRRGFFPWAHCGPLKWWTRRNRMVLFFPELHLPRSMKKVLRAGKYHVTFDTAFDRVVAACSERRAYNWHTLTWLTPRYRRLFAALHQSGHAHSFEVWDGDGRLVGGGFGVAVGRVFVGESMFSRETDTSKLGSAALYTHLERWGFAFVDARDYTPVLARTGFREIDRAEFEALLRAHADAPSPQPGRWTAEPELVASIGRAERIS